MSLQKCINLLSCYVTLVTHKYNVCVIKVFINTYSGNYTKDEVVLLRMDNKNMLRGMFYNFTFSRIYV